MTADGQTSLANSSHHALGVLSSILRSPELSGLWKKHHSNIDVSRVHELADELSSNAQDLSARPDLAEFATNFSRVELRALGAPKAGESREVETIRSYLQKLAGDMAVIPQEKVSASSATAETGDRILKILEKETGQVPFRPVRSSANFVKAWGGHLWNEFKEHKIGSSLLLAVTGAMHRVMVMTVPSSKIRLAPEDTASLGLHYDALDSAEPLHNDPSLIRTDLGASCHDHVEDLVQAFTSSKMIAKNVADWSRDALTVGDHSLFPKDCTGMNTYAMNVQQGLQTGYQFLADRLAWFTEDKVVQLGSLLPDSSFVVAFNEGAKWMGSKIYLFDTYENMIIHGVVYGSAALATHKCTSMNSEEFCEKLDNVKSFFNRTARNNKLNYIFGAAAASAYALSGAPHPEVGVFWAGVGGATAGHLAHKAMHVWGRIKHVQEIAAPVMDKLAAFKKNAADITAAPIRELVQEKLTRKFSMAKAAGVAAVAAVTTSCASLVYANSHVITNDTLREVFARVNEAVGTGLGGGLVAASYLVVNVPQDTVLHLIFAGAGIATGCVTGPLQKAVEKGIAKIRKPGGPSPD